jgi:hypothetical protein
LKIILKEIRKHAQTRGVSKPDPNKSQYTPSIKQWSEHKKTKGNKKIMIPMQSTFDFHASNGKAPEQMPKQKWANENQRRSSASVFQ